MGLRIARALLYIAGPATAYKCIAGSVMILNKVAGWNEYIAQAEQCADALLILMSD